MCFSVKSPRLFLAINSVRSLMKVTNEKKGIFSFHSHKYAQKVLMRAFPITEDLMFQLHCKNVDIQKCKDTDHKYCTLYIVKFFIHGI